MQVISWFDGLLPKSSTYMPPVSRPFQLTAFSAMGWFTGMGRDMF